MKLKPIFTDDHISGFDAECININIENLDYVIGSVEYVGHQKFDLTLKSLLDVYSRWLTLRLSNSGSEIMYKFEHGGKSLPAFEIINN